jgi:hypothetical protein
MRLGRAVDREIIRRRAGSELRVFCPRDHRGISLPVWIRGTFAPFFELEMLFAGLEDEGVRGLMWTALV